MQLRIFITDEKEKLMEQLRKTPTLQEAVDSWEEVSSAFRDDLEAKVGRLVDEEPARYHVRIGRKGSEDEPVLQLQSEELSKLSRLVLWTADLLSRLPELRGGESDDMACLASCLNDVFNEFGTSSVVRYERFSSVGESLPAIVDALLWDQAHEFAGSCDLDHVYRRLLLIDRWLAGAASGYSDELTLRVDLNDICDYGGCALCGDHDEFFVINKSFWFVCRNHKVCWCAGTDLFPVFHKPTDEERQTHHRMVATYRDIIPLLPPLMAV